MSSIYGRPNFRMIVWMFAISIIVILVAGVLFMRMDPLHLRKRSTEPHSLYRVIPAERDNVFPSRGLLA